MKGILLFLLLLFVVPGFSPNVAPQEPLRTPDHIQLEGDLAKRMNLVERRLASNQPFDLDLIVQDVARIASLQRRFEEYEGDVSGRLLGAWSLAARLRGERPAKLDSVAERILQHQNADGSFGRNQQPEGWDMWGRQNFGHGRLLIGLVEYYRLSGDQRFLESASKLGDYFAANIPKWTTSHEGHPWSVDDKIDWNDNESVRRHFVKTHQTSVLEALLMLYDESGSKKHLDAARAIVPLIPSFGQYHSHSYLNTLTGLGMLYERTGEPELLDRLKYAYWQEIVAHSRPVDGGVPEFYPDDARTEGCSVVDWLRLNLQMWRITKEAVYLDEAERTWLNALNFHQTPIGAFGHAHLTSDGYESTYSESWWCCIMHGLFAYADLARHIAAATESDLWVNFYTPASTRLDVAGRPVDLKIETSYPADGSIKVNLNTDRPRTFTLHLRIPEWADSWQARVNSEKVSQPARYGTLSIERSWQDGDVVELDLPVTLRVEDENRNQLTDRRDLGDYLHTAYFFHGPLLLGADEQWNRALPVSVAIQKGSDYRVPADELGEVHPFAIPEAHYRLPALFDWRSDAVTLVPISEFTGYGEWTEEWPNFMRNGEKPIHRPRVQTRHKVQVSGS